MQTATQRKVPRALRCSAKYCGKPIDAGGLCGDHRRGLALTVSVSDAIYRFLTDSQSRAVGQIGRSDHRDNDETEQIVIEAGEHLAHGLAMLIGTRFDGDIHWNTTPLQKIRERWRVRFVWMATGGNPLNFEESDDDDTDEIEGHDDEGNDDD